MQIVNTYRFCYRERRVLKYIRYPKYHHRPDLKPHNQAFLSDNFSYVLEGAILYRVSAFLYPYKNHVKERNDLPCPLIFWGNPKETLRKFVVVLRFEHRHHLQFCSCVGQTYESPFHNTCFHQVMHVLNHH